MKKLLYLLLIVPSYYHGQCVHNPTITSPRMNAQVENSILFCDPTDTETLSTQTYDSYQWYKQIWTWQDPNPNPWVAISGETLQTLNINGEDDFLYYFKVATTLDNCTEDSPAILVDGFSYSLPTMSTTLEANSFEQIDTNEFNVCNGSSVIFDDVFPQLYGVHTWYRCMPSNIPPVSEDPCIISGEQGDSITVTTSGEYGFYACTDYCPNQCEFLGASAFIKINFGNWDFCNLSIENPQASNNLTIYPNPTTQFLYIGKPDDKIYSEIKIIDTSGRLTTKIENHSYNQPIDVSNIASGNYIIISKSSDGKIYKNKFLKK